jgi:hypothetical protein
MKPATLTKDRKRWKVADSCGRMRDVVVSIEATWDWLKQSRSDFRPPGPTRALATCQLLRTVRRVVAMLDKSGS